jgi:hypothetical protein
MSTSVHLRKTGERNWVNTNNFRLPSSGQFIEEIDDKITVSLNNVNLLWKAIKHVMRLSILGFFSGIWSWMGAQYIHFW